MGSCGRVGRLPGVSWIFGAAGAAGEEDRTAIIGQMQISDSDD